MHTHSYRQGSDAQNSDWDESLDTVQQVCGLTSKAGSPLNGRMGVVLRYVGDQSRYEIEVT
eukprot:5411437-Amphidinium_carterae.1